MLSIGRMNRSKSHAAFERAKQLIPGGVNSPARAFGGVGGEPIFIARGEGPLPLRRRRQPLPRFHRLLGAADPRPCASARRRSRGRSRAATAAASARRPRRESELAELITRCVPSIEMVRMVSSGTEAAMSADPAGARLHRPRPHRQIRRLLSRPRRQPARLRRIECHDARRAQQPRRPGRLHRGYDGAALTTTWTLCASRSRPTGDKIAGVILEPVVGNMGLVTPSAEFRKELRQLTQQHGALLDLRRSDDRLPACLWRSPGTVRRLDPI